MSKKIWIDVNNINMGRIRGELPPELVDRSKAVYDRVGKYQCNTLEDWERGFMCDAHPEREIKVWEDIAAAFESYQTKLKRPANNDKKKLVVAVLIHISMGNKTSKHPLYKALKKCWKDV